MLGQRKKMSKNHQDLFNLTAQLSLGMDQPQFVQLTQWVWPHQTGTD